MDLQLLEMNGLSLEILQALSYESHLGIPLKRNLHHFDREALIDELFDMTKWLDAQEVLGSIALDYRIKSRDSILLKYARYYPDHQVRKVFNDIMTPSCAAMMVCSVSPTCRKGRRTMMATAVSTSITR